MAYEGLLLLGVLALCFLLPHIAIGIATGNSAPGWVLILHVFIVLGIYFVWHWLHGGQTLAMRTWKIRISDPDGNGATTNRLLLRYVLAWPSLTYFGAGILWAFFDRDKLFLHDRLAGTRIVSTE